MEIIHLPPGWAGYLNELAFFRQPSDEMQAAFAQSLNDVRAWHAFESAYWIDQAEQQKLENLAFLIEELSQGPPTVDFLVPRCFQVVELMEAVQADRDKAHMSRDPLINDLLLACACRLKGQADDRALPERAPRLVKWLEKLEEGFHAVSPQLPEAARQELEGAFDEAYGVAEELKQNGIDKELMGSLVRSSEMLTVLVEWRSQARQALAEKYQRWLLPLIGPTLEDCFKQLKGAPPPGRAAIWSERVEGLLEELSFWWGQNRELLPLPAEFLGEWISQVDQDLAELTDWEAGAQIDDQTLAQLEEWVEAVADGFTQARQRLKSVEHLRGGQPGYYFEAIQGLLRNSLPVVAVPELLNSSSPPESWREVVDAMLEFTKGGPRELLYEARDKLLELVPPPSDEPEQAAWICPFCQSSQPVGRTTCGHCGGGASVSLQVRSWQA